MGDIGVIRLLIAWLLGSVIGFERMLRGKPAGITTYSIMCMSSSLLTLLSVYSFGEGGDISRLVANIITAIGFVAGGVIYTTNVGKGEGKVKITGITTGVIIFFTASLGIAIGVGQIKLGVVSVILVETSILIGVRAKKKRAERTKREEEEEDTDS